MGYHATPMGHHLHHEHGAALAARRRSYRKNKAKARAQHKRWYNKVKHNPQFQRRQKMRRVHPQMFRMRRGMEALPNLDFVLLSDLGVGHIEDVLPKGDVLFHLEEEPDVPQTMTVEDFLQSVVLFSEEDIDILFDWIDEVFAEDEDEDSQEAGQKKATTYDRSDPELVVWVDGFLSRHPKMRRFLTVPVLRVEDPHHTRHPEASYTSKGIEVYPKFWALSPAVRDSVFAHEIGHHVLDRWGYQAMLAAAEAANVDVWDTSALPYSQHNFDEAFSDAFAEAHLNPSDLHRRYPAWAELVQVAMDKFSS